MADTASGQIDPALCDIPSLTSWAVFLVLLFYSSWHLNFLANLKIWKLRLERTTFASQGCSYARFSNFCNPQEMIRLLKAHVHDFSLSTFTPIILSWQKICITSSFDEKITALSPQFPTQETPVIYKPDTRIRYGNGYAPILTYPRCGFNNKEDLYNKDLYSKKTNTGCCPNFTFCAPYCVPLIYVAKAWIWH